MNEQVKQANNMFKEAVADLFSFLECDYGYRVAHEITPQGNYTITYSADLYNIVFSYFYGELNFCVFSKKNNRIKLGMDEILATLNSPTCSLFQTSKAEAIRPGVEKMVIIFRQNLIESLNDYSQFQEIYNKNQEAYRQMLPALWLKKADEYWNLGRKEKAIEIYQQYAESLSNLQISRVNLYFKSL